MEHRLIMLGVKGIQGYDLRQFHFSITYYFLIAYVMIRLWDAK